MHWWNRRINNNKNTEKNVHVFFIETERIAMQTEGSWMPEKFNWKHLKT